MVSTLLKRPYLSLVGTVILTAVLGVGLVRLEIRTDGAAIYPENNPIVQQTENDREAFYDP
ncbi:MAG: hypothetical protein ACE5K8_07320, partial [Candidatus Zixiibacteriota bacterium]